MSGGLGADFLEELKNESILAVTFYTSLGVVLVLVIIIILLVIGFCCLAKFIIRRNTREKDNEGSVSQSEGLELEERESNTKNGSDVKDNTHKERMAEQQENEVIDSKDDSPLIRHKESTKTAQENRTTDEKQDDKAIEGMYASVNKTREPGSEKTDDTAGGAETTGIATVTVGDDDYAEVQCTTNTVYGPQAPDGLTTKLRSRTIACTAAVVLEPGNEDYSRLVHVTQPNPRLSMPLLSEYDRIDLSGARRFSLRKDLEQDKDIPPKSSDYEMMSDPHADDNSSPPPLPTPITDDIIELKFGSNEEESTPSEGPSSKTKAESPPPLPPPFVEGEEPDNEVLYDNAPIILQNLNKNSASVRDGESGAASQVDRDERSNTAEGASAANVPDGIYENIGKGVG